MISVTDILNLLDSSPIWKAMKELPKRVETLEAQNRALNALLNGMPGAQTGEACGACGAPSLRKLSSKPTGGQFVGMGLRDETWICSACGNIDEREMVDK